MNFLVDENLPRALVSYFRQQGHSARHVVEVSLAGRDDQEILALALSEGLVIVTRDQDFDELSEQRRCLVLRVAVGNCSNAELVSRVHQAMAAALASFERGETRVVVS